VPDYTRFCKCEPGWGSFACQQQLLSLPLNAREAITATIPPGKWGFWEVNLPPWRGPGPGGAGGEGGAASDRARLGGGGGRGGGGFIGQPEQLLLTAERLPGPGYGGNPLLFLKPFGTKVCVRCAASWRVATWRARARACVCVCVCVRACVRACVSACERA
jgi:hypothetical protein